MNILLFTSSLGPGGAEKQIIYLANALVNDGNNVKILVYHENFFNFKLIDKRIDIVNISPKNHFYRLMRIRKFIRNGWQDVLISFLDTPNFIANYSSHKKRKWALITSERSGTPERFNGIKSKIYKFLDRNSDAIVCNSIAAKKLWEDKKPRFKNKLHSIYNFVPNYPVNSYKINEKRKIGVPASLKKAKNIFGLIDALTLIDKERLSSFEIHWFGSTTEKGHPTSAEIKRIIRSKNLENNLIMYDTTNDVIDEMTKMDIIALFSIYEGLPNAILEGLALGKPILMSEISDYDILVKKNGVTFNPQCPLAISEAILKIVSMEDKRLIEMGKESKIIADDIFSEEKILSDWNELIAKVINIRN